MTHDHKPGNTEAGKSHRRIGIDLGGTKIEGVITDGPLIQARTRVATEPEGGFQHIAAQVADLVRELAFESDLEKPWKVGVGMPGSVTRAGVVKNSNTVCLNGSPFRQLVQERLGQEVFFANDANCFALAEAIHGAGKGHNVVFGVIMGTGVGGGLIVNGRVHEGPQSIAGEWGHMVLRPESDRSCYCGHRGCVETYLAGPSLEKHYHEISGRRAEVPEIVAASARGHSAAVACITTWLESYGRALANLVNALDPDIVVLGGGVSKVDLLYTQGRRQVERFVFSDELVTPIVRHEIGDSAGVLGAALLPP